MKVCPLDLDNIIPWSALLAASFGRQPEQMTLLLRHFYGERQLVAWGVWDGERLAAQYSCLLSDLWLPGASAPQRVGMSINMAVHPDYRGRGLIKLVAQPTYEEVQQRGGVAGVGFSNAAGVQVDRRSKGYGYRVVGKLVSSLAFVGRWLLSKQSFASVQLTTAWPTTLPVLTPQSDKIHFAITPDSLQHRFAEHPFRRYSFGVQYAGEEVVGVVIYRPFSRWGFSGVSLLQAYGEDLPDLLGGWLQAIANHGIRLVHLVSSPEANLYQLLRQHRYCLPLYWSQTPYFLTAKPLAEATPDSLFDFANWDCVGGDVL